MARRWTLLPRLKEIDSEIPLLVLTGHGSIDLAVKAIKEGAEQFLTKPIEMSALQVILQRLLETQRKHHKHLASKSRRVRQGNRSIHRNQCRNTFARGSGQKDSDDRESDLDSW